jgi:hypothetical protein
VITWIGWLLLRIAVGGSTGELGALAESVAASPVPQAVVDLSDSAAVVYPGPGRTVPLGLLRRGVVVAVLERLVAADCTDGWLRVGEGAWICGAGHARRVDRPAAPSWPPPPERWAPLPFLYVHPLGHGRFLYDTPDDAVARRNGRPFPPGTWESVTTDLRRAGTTLYRTVSGSYLRRDDVRDTEPSALSGVFPDPAASPWPYGFVVEPVVDVYAEPPPKPRWASPPRTGLRLPRYAAVRVAGQGETWVRIGEERFLRRSDVRLFRLHPPPDGVGSAERWFDVDLTEQVFAAYEGPVPRFVTLASTGKGTLTPEGSFRIYRAAGTQTMRGIPTGDGRRTYEVRDVPWVMFFSDDRAIHGAFWHDEFGTPRSHGCINLAPAAARWVFAFAAPALPPGWQAIEPADATNGTLVNIHR